MKYGVVDDSHCVVMGTYIEAFFCCYQKSNLLSDMWLDMKLFLTEFARVCVQSTFLSHPPVASSTPSSFFNTTLCIREGTASNRLAMVEDNTALLRVGEKEPICK